MKRPQQRPGKIQGKSRKRLIENRKPSQSLPTNFLHPSQNDLYHWLLAISWSQFLILIGGFYLGINLLFALIYLTTGDGIVNVQPGSFLAKYRTKIVNTPETHGVSSLNH